MPRKQIYLVRHGETGDNLGDIVSGARSDPDLTDNGRDQARALKPLWQLLDCPPVIATGLKRTVQTAQAMTGSDPVRCDESLKERDLGIYDGKMTRDEYSRLQSPKDAESKADHSRRVSAAIEELIRNDSVNTMVVAHAGTIRRILGLFGVPDEDYAIGNTDMYRLENLDNGLWNVHKVSLASGEVALEEVAMSREFRAATCLDRVVRHAPLVVPMGIALSS